MPTPQPIFISHSSRDNAAAGALQGRLLARGFSGVFLDYDPELGLPAGRHWEQELYRQLRQCKAVIFLASKASAASRWCFAELALAISMGKPVFPLRLARGVKHPLLDRPQWIDLAAEGEPAYDRLWRGLQEHGIDPHDAYGWDPSRPPYPGLAAFEEEDAAVFFGRAAEVQALAERLGNSLALDGERGVAVIGPSGSGKSSLVRAGLIPKLRRPGSKWVVLRPMLPQADPVQMLARCLAAALAGSASAPDWRALHARLMQDPRELGTLVQDVLDAGGAGRRVVLLVIDQAEELVTLSADAPRRAFTRLLGESLASVDALRVVLTLRAEFLTAMLQRADLEPLLRQPFLLAPLQRALLGSTISGPAELAGLGFAPGLVQRIVDDTGGGDALPLMAFTLARLYQRVEQRHGRTIDDDDYRQVGGVEGALRQRADAVRADLQRQGLGAAVMPTLLQLLALDERSTPTRRRVALEAFGPDATAVVRAFEQARLLAKGGDDGKTAVWVTHEALFRVWPPLAAAIDAQRDWLRQSARLERDAADWLAAGRQDAYLLQGERLEAALQWREAAVAGVPPGPGALALLDASCALRERARARDADLLGNRLIGDHEADPERALLVALAGIQALGWRPRLHLALAYALAASRARALIELDDWIFCVALAGDGRRAAIGLSDGRVAMWSVEGPQRLWQVHAAKASRPSGGVRSLSFVAGDRYLVALGQQETHLVVLDAASGAEHTRLAFAATALADAAGGGLIAAADAGGQVRLWHADADFAPVATLDFGIGISCLAIDAQGRRVLTGCVDRSVRLRDIAGEGAPPPPLFRHEESLHCVAFSPDGTQAASAGEDGRVALWSVGQAAPPRFIAARVSTWALRWSADGRTLCTVNERHGLQEWDVASGTARSARSPRDSGGRVLAGGGADLLVTERNERSADPAFKPVYRVWLWDHGGLARHLRCRIGNAFSVARFALDDRALVTWTSERGVIAVRDPADGSVRTNAHIEPAFTCEMAVAPDGRSVALVEREGVALLSLPDLCVQQRLALDSLNRVAFEPGSQRLLTLTVEGRVQRWDGGRAETLIEVGEQYAGSLGLAPDGRHLLVAGNRRVCVYDLQDAREVFRLPMGNSGDLQALLAPDGSCIAVGQAGRLFTLGLDGTPRTEFAWGKFNAESAYAPMVGRLAFAPDSRRLATASQDGWVCLWDVASGELLQVLPVADQPLKDLAFAADGQRIVACTAEFVGEYDSNGRAEIWPCPDPPQLAALALRRTFRSLAPDEAAQFGLSAAADQRSAASTFHLGR